MKKLTSILICFCLTLLLCSCAPADETPIVATTLPVYEMTTLLCQDTGLGVSQLVTESVSCLHDYTLQVRQMRLLEGAQVVVISGGGLEDFLSDALEGVESVVDASTGIGLHHAEHHHSEEDDHHHENDPHIWLSAENAKSMATNICAGLCENYPQHKDIFQANLTQLLARLDALQAYGEETLGELSSRQLITFHDGFSYLAESFGLEILEAVEEESGSEASAAELIHLIGLVQGNNLPAIFVEKNGSTAAAEIISRETGANVHVLDMAISGDSYFDAMYQNINTLKEALG